MHLGSIYNSLYKNKQNIKIKQKSNDERVLQISIYNVVDIVPVLIGTFFVFFYLSLSLSLPFVYTIGRWKNRSCRC